LLFTDPWHRIPPHCERARNASAMSQRDRDSPHEKSRMTSGIGLCGAHRVGKTTLAQAVSRATGIPFLKTHTSHIFQQHGLDPAKPMAFDTRLAIQQEILAAGEAVWRQAAGPFISDRTPLDMAAYTLADIHGTTTLNETAFTQYLTDCLAATNRYFSTLIIVPPGIPLVPEPGKAALHDAYIEHIHTLIAGLCHDDRISAKVHHIGRGILSLDARVAHTVAHLP
jgi:hypothetical protein